MMLPRRRSVTFGLGTVLLTLIAYSATRRRWRLLRIASVAVPAMLRQLLEIAQYEWRMEAYRNDHPTPPNGVVSKPVWLPLERNRG